MSPTMRSINALPARFSVCHETKLLVDNDTAIGCGRILADTRHHWALLTGGWTGEFAACVDSSQTIPVYGQTKIDGGGRLPGTGWGGRY